MKKILFLFILFVSCTNSNIESVVINKLGSPTNEKTFNGNQKVTTWTNVELGKKTEIKNSVDKALNALPVKSVEFEPAMDSIGNVLPGELTSYYKYESPTTETELDFNYKGNNMTVILFITKK